MHHPTDKITHTMAFVTPVVEHWLERERAQWVHPMKDRSDDPSHHERTLLPRSYISVRVIYPGTQLKFKYLKQNRVISTNNSFPYGVFRNRIYLKSDRFI